MTTFEAVTGYRGGVYWSPFTKTSPTARDRGTLTYKSTVLSLLDEVDTIHIEAAEDATLQQATDKYLKMPIAQLLEVLSIDYGFSWTSIAQASQVSVPALRKWRQGGSITRENRDSLTKLAVLCDRLAKLEIENPEAFLEGALWPDVPLKVLDVFIKDRSELIMDYAKGLIPSARLLDAVMEDWRDRYPRPKNEIVFNEFGAPTIDFAPDGS